MNVFAVLCCKIATNARMAPITVTRMRPVPTLRVRSSVNALKGLSATVRTAKVRSAIIYVDESERHDNF